MDATLTMDTTYSNKSDSSPRCGRPNGSRQLTPPDSPLPSIHAVLGGSKTHTRKMALDFIAPSIDTSKDRPILPGLECLSAAAALHGGSRPSTPLKFPIRACHYSPHVQKGIHKELRYTAQENHDFRIPLTVSSPPVQYEYRTNLPSPVWSSSNSDYSDSQMYTLDPLFRHQSMLPPFHPGMMPMPEPRSRSMTYTRTPHVQNNRLQKRSIQHHAENKLYISPEDTDVPNKSRDERFTYDDEERYAILYLRGLKNLKYDDVLVRFNFLFPAGRARRCRSTLTDRGFPDTYKKRNVQGIQCRWYRIRDEEGLAKLRAAAVGSDRKKVEAILGVMRMERDLGTGFASRVSVIAEMPNETLSRHQPRTGI